MTTQNKQMLSPTVVDEEIDALVLGQRLVHEVSDLRAIRWSVRLQAKTGIQEKPPSAPALRCGCHRRRRRWSPKRHGLLSAGGHGSPLRLRSDGPGC